MFWTRLKSISTGCRSPSPSPSSSLSSPSGACSSGSYGIQKRERERSSTTKRQVDQHTFIFWKLFPTSVSASSRSIWAMRSTIPSSSPPSPLSPPSLISDSPSEVSLSPLSSPFSCPHLPSEESQSQRNQHDQLLRMHKQQAFSSPSIAWTDSMKESGSKFTSGTSPTCLYKTRCLSDQ